MQCKYISYDLPYFRGMRMNWKIGGWQRDAFFVSMMHSDYGYTPINQFATFIRVNFLCFCLKHSYNFHQLPRERIPHRLLYALLYADWIESDEIVTVFNGRILISIPFRDRSERKKRRVINVTGLTQNS